MLLAASRNTTFRRWQAEAGSGETVKESDNAATALAARSVLDRLASGGHFAKRRFQVERVSNRAYYAS